MLAIGRVSRGPAYSIGCGEVNRLRPCREPVCDNPQKTDFLMRPHRIVLAWIGGLALAGVLAWPQAPGPAAQAVPAPAPLVLAGGTVVDVTDWGRSAKDLQNSIVIIEAGRVVAVGSSDEVPIPKGARVIDCTGKYLIPGL